jgi:ABC-type histidine transport system ATPase subunit
MNFAREVANCVVFFSEGLLVEDGKPEAFKRFISKKY